jgi:putative membrane protein
MLDILIRVVIIAIALMAAVLLVPRVNFDGELWQLGLIALIFGAINAYLKPILKALSIPISLVAMGLVGLLINTLLVLLLAFIVRQLNIEFTLAGWPPGNVDVDVIVAAFLTALVVSVVTMALSLVRRIAPGI